MGPVNTYTVSVHIYHLGWSNLMFSKTKVPVNGGVRKKIAALLNFIKDYGLKQIFYYGIFG